MALIKNGYNHIRQTLRHFELILCSAFVRFCHAGQTDPHAIGSTLPSFICSANCIFTFFLDVTSLRHSHLNIVFWATQPSPILKLDVCRFATCISSVYLCTLSLLATQPSPILKLEVCWFATCISSVYLCFGVATGSWRQILGDWRSPGICNADSWRLQIASFLKFERVKDIQIRTNLFHH